jgi:FMN reductase
MAHIACIVGSPASPSRTAFVAAYLSACLGRGGNAVESVVLRELPPDDLLRARVDAPAIAAAVRAIERADGIVVATPIYKASFAGLLKVFLDLLPQSAFRDKSVLPIATGGASAHVLAIDYGLRPVLMSLGAAHVEPAYVVLEQEVRAGDAASYELTREAEAKLVEIAERFLRHLARASLNPPG